MYVVCLSRNRTETLCYVHVCYTTIYWLYLFCGLFKKHKLLCQILVCSVDFADMFSLFSNGHDFEELK